MLGVRALRHDDGAEPDLMRARACALPALQGRSVTRQTKKKHFVQFFLLAAAARAAIHHDRLLLLFACTYHTLGEIGIHAVSCSRGLCADVCARAWSSRRSLIVDRFFYFPVSNTHIHIHTFPPFFHYASRSRLRMSRSANSPRAPTSLRNSSSMPASTIAAVAHSPCCSNHASERS